VAAVAEAALAVDVQRADHLPVGWGNENWRVEAGGGERFVVKLGPPESAPKWQATRNAYAIAAAQDVPVPELLHFDPACAVAGGWVVRILRWIDGEAPASGAIGAAFFRELGAAVRRLHDHAVDAFSSRLDGSAPSFARWDGYVAHRWPQVRARLEVTQAFDRAQIDELEREITAGAVAVADAARPALCHRDLHLGNLLATEDGHLAAILDFDGAEAWDPAIDVVKLRWLVFPYHPGAAEAYAEGYGVTPPKWHERIHLVELLELTNTVANAIATTDRAFEQSARRRLADVRGR
jgi:aminoglycoside phosphotransferase (APT) family kinase protein